MLLDGDLLNKRNVSVPAYHDLILRSARSIGYPLLTKPLWDCLGNGITFCRSYRILNGFWHRRITDTWFWKSALRKALLY